MAEQIQKTKQVQDPEPQVQELSVAEVDEEELLGITDEMLDEIDSVLETNAEEFVEGFVQKGGQ